MDETRFTGHKTGEECTGCLACVNVCPEKCIEFDVESSMPYIENQSCCGCGKCVQICPVQRHRDEIKIYAAYAKDENIVQQSSSGGIFSLLAETVLNRGGIVFGAGFDEEFHVRHMAAGSLCDIDKIRRSKYVQSDIGNTYADAKVYLESGTEVLFTGTTCQIEGLLAYLEDKNVSTEKLYTQDLICHGTVLQEVWDKYLHEKCAEYHSKIKSVSFRDKTCGWLNFGLKIEFENGKTYFNTNNNDLYMQIFLNNMALRKSCYHCLFRGMTNRKSDITLADFWSVYRNRPGAFNPQGTSLVMVNSPKGICLFEAIRDKIVCEEAERNQISRSEVMAVTTVKEPVTRTKFMQQIKYLPLMQAYQNCKKIRYGVWGSFNLREAASRSGELVFQISNNSIVSLFSEKMAGYQHELGPNPLRNEMLKYDLDKKFIGELKSHCENTDYILIDFLEERFGVWKPDGEHDLTASDAWKDTGVDLSGAIDCCSEIFWSAWREACRSFAGLLHRCVDPVKIIVIHMFLATEDEAGNQYADAGKIEQINFLLERMYKLFAKECEKNNYPVRCVDIPRTLRYTQSSHKWGESPEHLNPRAAAYIAGQLDHMIGSEIS